MRFFYFSLLLISSLTALSSLPYTNLSSKLINAKEKLQKLSTTQALSPSQKNYINECDQLTIYSDEILKDADVSKKEAKLYLKKLRSLDATYEEVLANTRVNAEKAISKDDYAKFLSIIESDLPNLFEKSSFTKSAIGYYELNSKFQKSSVMQREVQLDKAKKAAKEEKRVATLEILDKLIQLKEPSPKAQPYTSNTASTSSITHTSNQKLKYMKTAYLDPKLFAKREQAFTPWLSKREYQSRFDDGYYKRKRVYPAYIELDKSGNRRVLEIAYEPKFYWSCTSGRLYNKFKKIHIGHTLNGKKLLSLHIQVVDGVKIYTGTWLSEEYINRELNKLGAYGIYP